MNRLLLMFSLLIVSLTVQAQSTNDDVILATSSVKDVANKTGKEVIVVDSVYSGKVFENHTLLNVGGNHPNQLLTILIKKQDYKNFEGDILKLYLNKKISVAGKVSNFNDKPQIVVTDPKKQMNTYLMWKNGLYVVVK